MLCCIISYYNYFLLYFQQFSRYEINNVNEIYLKHLYKNHQIIILIDSGYLVVIKENEENKCIHEYCN